MPDWKHQRECLVQSQNGRCHYCRRMMSASDSGLDTAATLDHRVARSLGGRTDWANTVAACLKCNAAKADKHEHEFKRPAKHHRKAKHQPTAAEIAATQRKCRERLSLWRGAR